MIAIMWFPERMPENLKSNLPDNLVFTGYTRMDESNGLSAKSCAAILILSRKNKPLVKSDSLLLILYRASVV